MNSRHLPILPLVLALVGAAACEAPEIKTPGAQLSGQVQISSLLKPLLPPEAGAQGTNITEVEPNTVPPTEVFDAGSVTPDAPPLIISGTMVDSSCGAGSDCR